MRILLPIIASLCILLCMQPDQVQQLLTAIRTGEGESAAALLSSGGADLSTEQSKEILRTAVESNNAPIVDSILTACPKIKSVLNTPLSWVGSPSIWAYDPEVIKVLGKHGADPDCLDDWCCTFLESLVNATLFKLPINTHSLIAALIRIGADPTRIGVFDSSPLSMAAESGLHETRDLMIREKLFYDLFPTFQLLYTPRTD